MHSNMLDYIKIFIKVVDSGSFTKAADALQLHRPAVSKAIRQLEDELGVKLIHRTTRNLRITSEGDAFYQRSRHILAEMNDMMANFSPSCPPRGDLTIDAPPALAHSLLVPGLAGFQARYPDINIILISSDKKTDLIARGVDCVIRMGVLEDSSLISKRLGEISMVTCAAPAYLDRYGRPASPDDLQHHRAVNFFSENSRDVMAWRFMDNGKMVSRQPERGLLVDNSDVLLSCALAGLGIIQATRNALTPHIRAGHLEPILTDYPCEPKPVSIIYPDRRYVPAKVRVFIDWFSHVMAENTEK